MRFILALALIGMMGCAKPTQEPTVADHIIKLPDHESDPWANDMEKITQKVACVEKNVTVMREQAEGLSEIEAEFAHMSYELAQLHDENVNAIMRPHIERASVLNQNLMNVSKRICREGR